MPRKIRLSKSYLKDSAFSRRRSSLRSAKARNANSQAPAHWVAVGFASGFKLKSPVCRGCSRSRAEASRSFANCIAHRRLAGSKA